MRSIQRDQSVSSGIQRSAVGEPLIGYALEIDGVPLLTHGLNTHSALASTVKALIVRSPTRKSHFVVCDAE